MNGSSRAPNRDFVRRTPLPTARMRPLRLVRIVTMRSASPSFWVRSTIPSSRYRLTLPLSRTAGPAMAQARAPGSRVMLPDSRRALLARGTTPALLARGDDPPEPPETAARREHASGTPPLAVDQARRDRFTADSTARSDAVTVFASMPTPHQGWPPISHST